MTAIACLHLRYPFTAVLGGVLGPVASYRLLSHAPPGIGWSVRFRWDTLSQVHLLGGNRTRTVIELSGTGVPATDTCTLVDAVVSQRIAPGPRPNSPAHAQPAVGSDSGCRHCCSPLLPKHRRGWAGGRRHAHRKWLGLSSAPCRHSRQAR